MENEELISIETMTPLEVGKLLGMNQNTVRAGLIQGRFPFGVAIAPEEGRTKEWTYNIIKSKVLDYAGIETENKDSQNTTIFEGENMDFEKIYKALIKILGEQHNVIIKTTVKKKETVLNEDKRMHAHHNKG